MDLPRKRWRNMTLHSPKCIPIEIGIPSWIPNFGWNSTLNTDSNWNSKLNSWSVGRVCGLRRRVYSKRMRFFSVIFLTSYLRANVVWGVCIVRLASSVPYQWWDNSDSRIGIVIKLSRIGIELTTNFSAGIWIWIGVNGGACVWRVREGLTVREG